MHMLEGIVRGITLDGRISDDEMLVLNTWIEENAEYANRHPFTEVIPRLQEIMHQVVLDEEERADLLWFCNQFTTEGTCFDEVTADLQVLHGLMGGMVADSKITEEELRSLRTWLDDKPHLQGCWPFEEMSAIVTGVLADGRIDSREHEIMLSFCADVMAFMNHRAIDCPICTDSVSIGGVCSADPQIRFDGRRFCFTGKPKRGTKQVLQTAVLEKQGVIEQRVVQALDYLIVGADGNECWAYSAYGRKVEQAITMRKQGSRLLIVHEFDFWDAVESSET